MPLVPPTAAYAAVSDLVLYGAPAAAFAMLPTATQQAAVDAANALADGYLANKFTLPLKTWSADLVKAVVAIATYDLIVVRGANPEAPGNVDLHDRWQAALQWFRDIAAGRVDPQVTDSSVGGANTGGDYVRAVSTDQQTGFFVSARPVSGRGW